MSFLYAFAELRSLPNITLQNSTSCKWSVPQLRAICTLEIIYDTNNAMTTTTAKSCTCHLSGSWFCLVYYQKGALFLIWSLFLVRYKWLYIWSKTDIEESHYMRYFMNLPTFSFHLNQACKTWNIHFHAYFIRHVNRKEPRKQDCSETINDKIWLEDSG